MVPATPGPKLPENGPEPEFLRNFEPTYKCSFMLLNANANTRIPICL
jgi:hypothetical protein